LLLPSIEKIHRRNAQSLVERMGTTAFSQITGLGPARASRLVGRSPSRNIGRKPARRVERVFGEPEGWLDADHTRSIAAVVKRLSALESPYDERDTRIWQDALSAAIRALHRLQP
jgi:hypothetical protein